MRGKYQPFIHEFEHVMNKNLSSPIIFMQDMGIIGLDSPIEMTKALYPHKIIINSNSSKKSRSSGLIIHKDWEVISKIYRHESGGLVGVRIRKDMKVIFVMSAYLPFP